MVENREYVHDIDHVLLVFFLSIDPIYSDITDIETALVSEIGDVILSTDYPSIFSNCCHILTNLF